jgi:hypothetical protein
MAVFMSPLSNELDDDERLPPELLEGQAGDGSATPTVDDVLEEKRVVDLSVEEARNLLANIKDRSEQTLKLFATGKPVALASLIGPGGEYRDYNELKRSFVGAVNRRLRTVCGIRNAALFSSDRDKTRIKITQKTAQSLRAVFDMPEPMPEFEFIDPVGNSIDAKSDKCQELSARLVLVWSELSSRPTDSSTVSWAERVLKHFASSGLELFVGTPTGWNDETQSDTYDFHTVIHPFGAIQGAIEHGYPLRLDELAFGLESDAQVLARPAL